MTLAIKRGINDLETILNLMGKLKVVNKCSKFLQLCSEKQIFGAANLEDYLAKSSHVITQVILQTLVFLLKIQCEDRICVNICRG